MASDLPPLYKGWMTQLLGAEIPPETEATCQHCVMVLGQGAADDRDRCSFDSTTRCCTYFPELPNFLVGQILTDEDPRAAVGRRSVETRLDRGVSVTPLGLATPAPYSLLYANGTSAFGASRALRCPHHLDDGGCGIWTHRMSVCATWFCKYTRGAVGLKFWRELQVLLSAVETDLAAWCLLELKLATPALAALFPPPALGAAGRTLDRFQLDERPDPERYAAVWGSWAGREREFFEKCGRRVAELEWPQVLRICGPRVQVSARLARDALAALRSRELPQRLRVGDFHVFRASAQAALVVSYNGYDPLRLPASLMEALPYFDGRPVNDALRAIEREKQVRLCRDLVLRLVDFSILVPVPPRMTRRRSVAPPGS